MRGQNSSTIRVTKNARLVCLKLNAPLTFSGKRNINPINASSPFRVYFLGFFKAGNCDNSDKIYCEKCGAGTFTAHENSVRKCLKCKNCGRKYPGCLRDTRHSCFIHVSLFVISLLIIRSYIMSGVFHCQVTRSSKSHARLRMT